MGIDVSELKKRLVIVVLNFEAYQETECCVDQILAYHMGIAGIIIVDNDSKNESVAYLRKKYNRNKKIKIVKSNRNRGVAKGNNFGIKIAREKWQAEYILLLNSDTFEGFDKNDVIAELELKNYAFNSGSFAKGDSFKVTDEDIVMCRMPFPDKCIIKKGYFPDSVKDMEDTFCFVNLDMDLYKPMLSALEYFYGRMTGETVRKLLRGDNRYSNVGFIG